LQRFEAQVREAQAALTIDDVVAGRCFCDETLDQEIEPGLNGSVQLGR
jgi:hypothetical protein